MRRGYLSQYFEGIAAKRLSAVEAHPERSNQHEFNGVQGIQAILGPCIPRQQLPARFMYLSDSEEPVVEDTSITWYDSREQHPTRSECRLYFRTTDVSERAEEGDVLVLGKLHNGDVISLIAPAGSTAEQQVLWLFDLSDLSESIAVKPTEEIDQIPLKYAARLILGEIGVEEEETEPGYLEMMLERFGGAFPTTDIFSAFARETLSADSRSDPDLAITEWMEREDTLFRTLERHLIMERLQQGFEDDVDEFISFSLSVQNRRKSRAGQALENHIEQVLKDHEITYSRGKVTENRAKPDFIFPGINYYHDSGFPESRLTMLGAKRTCKDRWRQVLSEAERINEKHLLTFEPGISENQTDEMRSNSLRLVVPSSFHDTYLPSQRSWLLGVEDFLSLVKERQTAG